MTSGTGAEIRKFKNYSSESGYWDGTYKSGNPLPDGTYYYFLTINGEPGMAMGGKTIRMNGFLVIKRLVDD